MSFYFGFLSFEDISELFTTPLVQFGQISISLSSIAQIILSFIFLVLLCRLLKSFLTRSLLVRFGFDAGNREAIATIITYAVGTIGFLIILQAGGLNLASLAVVAGGLGVGIGFGLQDVTKNFASGLTLLVERSVKVGDLIVFDGMEGFVESISLRSTILRTWDGGDVVVPNSQLVDNRILNWSYKSFQGRITIPVGVAYGSDPLVVTEILLQSAYMESATLSDPAPIVTFRGFGDSALIFELRVWVSRIDNKLSITSSLHYIIEYNLRQNEIEIPFPQTDLWLRNPESLNSVFGKEKKALEDKYSFLQDTSSQPRKPLSIRDLLRQITYFENFSDLELRLLIEAGYRKRLQPLEVLFREGDPGDAFYIVLSGAVEVYVEKIDKHLTTLKAGQFFGELSLLLGIPRTATVRAEENTILFLVNKKGFEKLLKKHPEIAEIIVQALGKYKEELAERQKQLRELGLVDASEDDKNPVVWVRKRLTNLFSLQ